MMDSVKIVVKKNVKFIIAMLVVIILGIFGISYALKIASVNKIGRWYDEKIYFRFNYFTYVM